MLIFSKAKIQINSPVLRFIVVYMRLSRLFSFALIWLCGLTTRAQSNNAAFWSTPNPWVDSVFNSMTEAERIGQLFMVAAWSNKDSAHVKEIQCLVRDHKIGGIIFFKGGPVRQAILTNYYQSISKVPLLVGIDGEWGLSMRLDSTPTFPRQMMLGAANDDTLMYRMGLEIGKHCKRMGIHLNFAPVVDINNNPRNPVINDRSFGEDKHIVSSLGIAYTRGMQSQRVMACAKHFPGHGDTDSDSHYNLPVIKKSKAELDSVELFPFRELFNDGVMSVMNAHLSIPKLDSTPNLASSLSPIIINGLLKKEMGFKGLVLTDALNMQGVSKYNAAWDINILSLKAGNDVLLFAEEVPYSIEKIKMALDSGWLDSTEIHARIKKILLSKYWAGLNNYSPIDLNNLVTDINCCSTDLLIREVIERSAVIAKNSLGLIPLKNLHTKRVALVASGTKDYKPFEEFALSYARMDVFFIDKTESDAVHDSLLSKLKGYDLVITALHNTSRFVSRNFGLTEPQVRFINRLNNQNQLILVNNGNPYSMQRFPSIKSLIISYEDQPWNNEVAAQLLFGARTSFGRLPVSVYEYALGSGENGEYLGRLKYVLPEQALFDSKALAFIDTLVTKAIADSATPGAQVIVAKNGNVVYHKSFGTTTYTNGELVTEHHLYDLASLTKVLSTTLVAMKLHELHELDLDRRIGFYLPELKSSNKRQITVRQLLLHESGLPPFIPFYKKTLVGNNLNPLLYSETSDSNFTVQVAANLWLHKDYSEVMYDEIMDCPLNKEPGYVYSDLNMILLKKIIEKITETGIEKYVDSVFYKPLGLATIGFRPLSRFDESRIVPTETDSLFRKQLLRGYVHDPGAAMMGGVAGHAGLFSNASDVAVIMQMLLNRGEYGGIRFFKSSIVDEFTQRSSKIGRRGLGFDKAEYRPKKNSPCSKYASPLTFGHTGFTGTCAWADPENGLLFIFLSNRIHPSAENSKLIQQNIRTNIHDLLYDMLK